MPELVTCATCGKVFRRPGCHIGKQTYCSQACYHARTSGEGNPNWRGGNETHICEWCGNKYEIPKAWIRKGTRFCSRSCKGAWSAKYQFTGANSHNWQGGPVTMICEQCGKEYTVSRGIFNNRTSHFCGRRCMGDWKAIHNQRENGPGWMGGLDDDPYPIEWNEPLRRRIRQRDGNRCVLCGRTEDDVGRQLSVHHIDYDKNNTAWGNLVSLCTEHHIMTNANRTWWSYWLPRYSRGKYLLEK